MQLGAVTGAFVHQSTIAGDVNVIVPLGASSLSSPVGPIDRHAEIASASPIQVSDLQTNAGLVERADELLNERVVVGQFSQNTIYGNVTIYSSPHVTTEENLPSLQCLIERNHSDLLGIEEKISLGIYVPIHYSQSPPSLADSRANGSNLDEKTNRLSLDALKEDMLCGSGDDARNKKIVFIQGLAGTGKTLFAWRTFQEWDRTRSGKNSPRSTNLRIPIVIPLPLYRDFLEFKESRLAFIPYVLTKLFPSLPSFDKMESSQIQQLKSIPFVFFLDSMDELGLKFNLYEECGLRGWENSLVVMSARTGYFTDADYAKYVAPKSVEGTPEPSRIQYVYLLPFDTAQQKLYIDKYCSSPEFQEMREGYTSSQYTEALKLLPGVEGLLMEPLFLFIVLSIVPTLVDRATLSQDSGSGLTSSSHSFLKKSRLDMWTLKHVSVEDSHSPHDEKDGPHVFPSLKRVEVYSLFVLSWARRQLTKLRRKMNEEGSSGGPLINDEPKFLERVLNFCSRLSFELFVRNQPDFNINKGKEKKPETTNPKRLDSDDEDESEEEDVEDETKFNWVHELLAKYQTESECAPLRKSADGTYKFLHETFREFFIGMAVAKQLVSKVRKGDKSEARASNAPKKSGQTALENPETHNPNTWYQLISPDAPAQQSGYDSKSDKLLYISQKRLNENNNYISILRMMGELLDSRVFNYIPSWRTDLVKSDDDAMRVHPPPRPNQFQPLGRALWDIVESSRYLLEKCSTQKRARAIASANAMMIINASGTLLFSGRDLSGGLFCDPEYKGTEPFMDLSGAVLQKASLRDAHLARAVLDQVCLDVASVEGANLSNVSFGQRPMFLGHTSVVTALVSDEKHLYSGSGDSTIRVWNWSSGEYIRAMEGHSRGVSCLCLSRDGDYLYSGSMDNTVRVWNLSSGECVRTMEGHTGDVTHLCLSSGGADLYSASDDTTIRVWKLSSGECVRTMAGHWGKVTSLCLSRDGVYLYSGSWDNTIRVWNLSSGECVRTMGGHNDFVTSLRLSDDRNCLYSGSWDKTIRVWNLSSGECVRAMEGHTNSVASLCLSRDGDYLYSGSDDESIRVWKLSTGECVRTMEGHTNAIIVRLCLSRDGDYLYSGLGTTIRVWNLSSGECVRTVAGHWGKVTSLCLSRDGVYLYSGSWDNTIRMWNLSSGECVRAMEGHTNSVASLCLSRDGDYLYSGSDDESIRVWQLSTGECIRTVKHQTDRVTSLCISRDNGIVYSASGDNTIRVWNLSSGECARTIEGHTDRVTSLCISHDSDVVLSGSEDNRIRVSNLSSGECVRTMEGHTGTVTSLFLSHKGDFLYSGSWDKTIRVWNLSTGECVGIMEGHLNGVTSLCLSRDGVYLYSGSSDNTIRVTRLVDGVIVLLLGNSRLSAGKCILKDVVMDATNRQLLMQLGALP